jgi:hypothetical protein
MDQCCHIACGWAERMQVEIQHARDNSQNDVILQTQERRYFLLIYALLSYEMIVVSPDSLSNEKRLHKIIELRLLITRAQSNIFFHVLNLQLFSELSNILELRQPKYSLVTLILRCIGLCTTNLVSGGRKIR